MKTATIAEPAATLAAMGGASVSGEQFGIYVHVPYCAARCGYCDFNTYTAAELGGHASRLTFVHDAIAELRMARRFLSGDAVVQTVFFGGGTPTLLPAAHLIEILRVIDGEFGLAAGAEVTVEANPESVDAEMLARLAAGGFTRISFGMQSAVPRILALLDRRHTPGTPELRVAQAFAAGFQHVNLDLIYGTPTESDADWRRSLEAAVAAGPDHISAYALTVEPGTALARRIARGDLPAPDDDVAADRYRYADEFLSAMGYSWYEISNWARPGAECRHNLGYWRDGVWWGVGPGAHSFIAGRRWWNVKHPAAYAERLAAGVLPVAGVEVLSDADRHVEDVMLRLRLAEGLPTAALREGEYAAAVRAAADGLLDADRLAAGRCVLTLRGRLLADTVIRDILH